MIYEGVSTFVHNVFRMIGRDKYDIDGISTISHHSKHEQNTNLSSILSN